RDGYRAAAAGDGPAGVWAVSVAHSSSVIRLRSGQRHGGGEWESNPPRAARPVGSFEDCEAHQDPCPSGSRILLSRTPPGPADPSHPAQRCTRRSRSALPTTETELKLIAAAAIIGLSSRPKKG